MRGPTDSLDSLIQTALNHHTNHNTSQDTDNAVVHHRLPILEVGVRRIVAPDHAGFALYGPGVSGPQGGWWRKRARTH